MTGWTSVWDFAFPTFKKCTRKNNDNLQGSQSLWKIMVAYWNIDAILDICKLSFLLEWHHINSSSTKELIN